MSSITTATKGTLTVLKVFVLRYSYIPPGHCPKRTDKQRDIQMTEKKTKIMRENLRTEGKQKIKDISTVKEVRNK